MGHIEKAIKSKVRRTRINSAIIKTVAIAGVVAIAVLAPNTLQALAHFGILPHRQNKQRINRSLGRLIEDGYVRVVYEGKEKRIQLTAKGEKFAALLGVGRLAPKIPRRWDSKWRILIFDIPEKRKRTREQIRVTLINLGFVRLQDSVWVYPYDCEDLITLFKLDFRLGNKLLYIVADRIENENTLRKVFGFSKI